MPPRVLAPPTVGIDLQNIGIFLINPGWSRSGRRRETSGDSAGVELTQDPVEPLKSEHVFRWLKANPAKNREGDDIDVGLAHQTDILVPDVLRPLFRVVVAAVQNTAPICRRAIRVGHR